MTKGVLKIEIRPDLLEKILEGNTVDFTDPDPYLENVSSIQFSSKISFEELEKIIQRLKMKKYGYADC